MAEREEDKKAPRVTYEPEEIRGFYANVAQVTTTPYDVIVTFGRRKPERDQEGGLVIADAVQIYMSPQHARSVAELMERQLVEYEELYGPLPSDGGKVADSGADGEPKG